MLSMKESLVLLAAAAGLLVGSLSGAAPASAANNLNMTGPQSGTPGQTVTYVVSGSALTVGSLILIDQNNTQWANVSVGVGVTNVPLSFQVPSSGSPLQLTAYNYDTNFVLMGQTNTITLSFDRNVPTATQISAPNNARVGTPTKITVYVQSQNGSSYSPTGNVVFRDASGNVVSTNGLAPNGAGSAYAYWWWTPPAAGTYVFVANYQGDGIAQASTSQQDTVFATTSGNTISLTEPGTMTVGVPVLLTATLIPRTIQGSVGFTFNGAPISASVPIVNGVATFTWTPTVAGTATMGANFTTNGGQSGSTTDTVKIVPGPASQDNIALTQPGYGTWAPNGTYQLGVGTVVPFTATTSSGAAVTLSVTGPCTVNGLTLTVNATGQCNLKAASPGGGSYAGVTYGYTIATGPGTQVPVVNPPNSGRITKGRSYKIAPAGPDTNAGQLITWRVTAGKSVCKISYPSDGTVVFKAVKAGQCTLLGTAPGVGSTWAPLTIQRSYRS
jgi:hypothetical protein